jgi:hypothetical protein
MVKLSHANFLGRIQFSSFLILKGPQLGIFEKNQSQDPRRKLKTISFREILQNLSTSSLEMEG